MLLILTVLTLGQVHRHRTVSVRLRVPLKSVKADDLKPQRLVSFKAILVRSIRVRTMQSHSSAGTLQSRHCPAEHNDGRGSNCEVKKVSGRDGHSLKRPPMTLLQPRASLRSKGQVNSEGFVQWTTKGQCTRGDECGMQHDPEKRRESKGKGEGARPSSSLHRQ